MSSLIPAERQKKIINLVQQQGVVRVAELSELFSVSVLTVRRDLALLEEQGVLERSHGGAVLRRRMASEPLYHQKVEMGADAKRKIGIEAASLVNDDETVFINSGSTTKEVILALQGRRVKVVTNNIEAVSALSGDLPEILLIGGQYRSRSMSTVGQSGFQQLKSIYADKAILGVDGFSIRFGLTTPVQAQADITREMIEQTMGKVIIVADHSKIGVVSNHKTAQLDQISILVSNREAEEMIDQDKLDQDEVSLLLV